MKKITGVPRLESVEDVWRLYRKYGQAEIRAMRLLHRTENTDKQNRIRTILTGLQEKSMALHTTCDIMITIRMEYRKASKTIPL